MSGRAAPPTGNLLVGIVWPDRVVHQQIGGRGTTRPTHGFFARRKGEDENRTKNIL
jgi:hypothetical protein